MPKREQAKPVRRGAGGKGQERPGQRSGSQFLLLGVGVVAVIAVAVFFLWSGNSDEGSETADPASDASLLASANAAGAPVNVLKGSHHTVYHSTDPLPSASAPRADGRPTLVWFSGTWCEFCERMEPYAHETASQFGKGMVFVEKSVDDDRNAASRFGIRGTPTFVLIDASGKELTRFGFQSTSQAFAQAIQTALSVRS